MQRDDGDSANATANTPCLVCRSRKVKCDRTRPACNACTRLKLVCPGYNGVGAAESQPSSAEGVYQASGVAKRKIGTCLECRQIKARCSRMRPRCDRCQRRGLPCTYPGRRGKTSERSPEPAVASSISRAGDHGTSGGQQSEPASVPDEPAGMTVADASYKWLYDDGLPTSRERFTTVFEAFFNRIYPLRCLGFIHKPTFMQAFATETVQEQYGGALLYIVCALGANFVEPQRGHVLGFGRSLHSNERIPGSQWAKSAQNMVMANLASPSIPNLMAMILLCEYATGTDDNALAFVLLGACYRVMRLLGIDEDDFPHDPETRVDFCDQEISKRLVWSCHILDSMMSSGTEADSCWSNRYPRIPLPTSDHNFTMQEQSNRFEVPDLDSVESGNGDPSLGLRAQTVLLMRLRTTVLKTIRMSTTFEESGFEQVLSTLQTWFTSLPASLRMTDINLYVHKETNTLGPLFFIHLAYHAAVADLTRVTLPGFNFPLAAAFQNVSPEYRRFLSQRCCDHANEISQLVQMGMRHGSQPFDDPFCFHAVYEASKIQIVFATTIDSTSEGLLLAESNLRENTRLMTLLGRNGSHHHVRPLLSLLHRFGFQRIAEEWDAPQLCVPDESAEISGPAASNYLSNVSTIRLAKEQIRQRQDRSASSVANKDSPANERESVRSWQTPTEMPVQHAQGEARMPMSVHDVRSRVAGSQQEFGHSRILPAAAINSASHNQDLETSFLISSASADEYAELASEMSDHLLWNFNDFSSMWPGSAL